MKLHLSLAFVLALSATSAAKDLLDVVPVSTPPGSFPTIAAAIAAASDGDVVRVQPGTYAGFRLTARDLTIAAAIPGSVSITSTVLIRDIASPNAITLHGLTINGLEGPAVEVVDCDGSVRLVRCALEGDQGALVPDNLWIFTQSVSEVFAALQATRAEDLALQDCHLRGADGMLPSDPYGIRGIEGAPGADMWSSRAVFHSTTSRGGDSMWAYGLKGGPGARLYAAELTGIGASFTGGRGSEIFQGHYCDAIFGLAGAGGDGLHLEGGAVAALRDSQAIGGIPGLAYSCGEQAGAAGNRANDWSAVTTLVGAARSIRWSAFAVAADVHEFEVEGEPGDRVFLRGGALTGMRPLPGLGGALLLSPPYLTQLDGLLGVVPAQGTVQMRLTTPALESSQIERWQVQIMIRPAAGARLLSASGPLVILEPGL